MLNCDVVGAQVKHRCRCADEAVCGTEAAI